jgi:hypothetical protein
MTPVPLFLLPLHYMWDPLVRLPSTSTALCPKPHVAGDMATSVPAAVGAVGRHHGVARSAIHEVAATLPSSLGQPSVELERGGGGRAPPVRPGPTPPPPPGA